LTLKILIADDEKDVADTYAEILERRGHQVVITYNGADCITEYLAAFQNMQQSPYDVVIIDHTMPVMNGAEVARKILTMNPKQQLVFISGYGSELLSSLSGISNIDFLTKPAVPEALIKLIEA
jgi:two-component system cell cycle response regulator CpdR